MERRRSEVKPYSYKSNLNLEITLNSSILNRRSANYTRCMPCAGDGLDCDDHSDIGQLDGRMSVVCRHSQSLVNPTARTNLQNKPNEEIEAATRHSGRLVGDVLRRW